MLISCYLGLPAAFSFIHLRESLLIYDDGANANVSDPYLYIHICSTLSVVVYYHYHRNKEICNYYPFIHLILLRDIHRMDT